jgi:uncharacterized protein (TIGR03067 family)
MTPILLGLAMAVGAPQAKEKPKAEPSMIGEWELEARTMGGAPILPFARSGHLRYTFTAAGECVVSTVPGVPPSRHSFTVDPKADPPAFTFLYEMSGTAVDGIYKVDGDTLTLCWDRGPKAARPKAFESPVGTQVVLYVLKRVKAKE